MKNILITGGAGYIGSHVIEKLIKRKKKVFIVDNLVTGYKKLINKKAKFYKLNILKTKKLRNIILKNKINTKLLKDSKLLSKKDREKLNIYIKKMFILKTQILEK